MDDWKAPVRRGGSLRQIPLENSASGWSSPPGDFFHVRGLSYFSKKQKVPAGECLLQPLGVDWLKSSSKLDHFLAHPENRVMRAVRAAQEAEDPPLKAFILAVNLQLPGREHHSLLMYFITEEAIPSSTLLHRFIQGDDAFRNNRLKITSKIVRGPWMVRTAVGNHGTCLLGKALRCTYFRGSDYLEIDADIGSSALASAILHLALAYVNSVAVEMAFLIESQTEEELPERVLGACRISHLQVAAAGFVESHDAPIVQHSINSDCSWRKFSRSISMLTHAGKYVKVEIEQETEEGARRQGSL